MTIDQVSKLAGRTALAILVPYMRSVGFEIDRHNTLKIGPSSINLIGSTARAYTIAYLMGRDANQSTPGDNLETTDSDDRQSVKQPSDRKR
jgi:hypothetical protein